MVGELVTNSTIHAGTNIELSVAWNLGLLRLTVAEKARTCRSGCTPSLTMFTGEGLSVVAALSRAFGVLPTADGGKLVWAVLNAARPQTNDRRQDAQLELVLEK